MSWSRVVWKELLREEEMTIPTIWIVDKNVCWPKGINVIRACSQQWPPKDDWMKYPIIKIKIQSDDKSLCDGFDFTSEEENEDLHNTKKQKGSIAVKRKASMTQSPFQQPFKSPFTSFHSFSNVLSTESQSSLFTSSSFSQNKIKEISPIILPPIHQQPFKSRIPQRILKPSQPNSPFISTSTVSKSYEQESINTSNIGLNKFPLTEARFQYKVLHKLQEILEEIKKQGEINELPDSTYFINQMSDLEGFNDFDKGLNDICQHTRLRTQLSKIGGVSCYTNVKSILLKLMTNKLMSSFNMDGTRNKNAFRKTNLMKVIAEAMPKYDETEIEKCVGNVLKRAPDRKGGGGRDKENHNDSFKDIF